MLFSMMWFSGFHFLTAVQIAQNWAISLDVNLLAAGANFSARASTGTGIFGGKNGTYVAEMRMQKLSIDFIAKQLKR